MKMNIMSGLFGFMVATSMLLSVNLYGSSVINLVQAYKASCCDCCSGGSCSCPTGSCTCEGCKCPAGNKCKYVAPSCPHCPNSGDIK